MFTSITTNPIILNNQKQSTTIQQVKIYYLTDLEEYKSLH